MSVLVVGSIALDTLETPHGIAESVLGGSAVYFSFAAGIFSQVRLVSIVGEDFPGEYRALLKSRDIGLEGLTVAPGETFRWNGHYAGAMSEAETREVQLNVFENYEPAVPEAYRDSTLAFLANSSPRTQLHVREQLPSDTFVLADTMNLWIETEREALLELLDGIDGLILNDAEARLLTGEHNLIGAGRWVLQNGPTYCIIKKAEHGAMLLGPEGIFVLPGYPTEKVKDPTGAGDSFAGGLMGFAATAETVAAPHLRAALAYGTVVASYTIEEFGTARLGEIEREDVDERLRQYVRMTHLHDIPDA